MMKFLTAALLLTVSSAAYAQPSSEPSETTEKFGSWTVRCVARKDDAQKACEVVLAVQGQGGPIAQIAVGRPQGEGDTLVVVRTPLGVSISEPVTMTQEGADTTAISLPFFTCLANGCLAQGSVAGDRLGALTAQETVTLAFADRTGRKVQIRIPVDGLAEALGRIGLDCSSNSCAASQ